MNAERVHIDNEEDGFHLLVKAEDGEWFDFHIQDIAEQVYDRVRAEIGPWLYERDQGRLAFLCTPDESGGLDLSHPSHPDFHSVHADHYDGREKTR